MAFASTVQIDLVPRIGEAAGRQRKSRGRPIGVHCDSFHHVPVSEVHCTIQARPASPMYVSIARSVHFRLPHQSRRACSAGSTDAKLVHAHAGLKSAEVQCPHRNETKRKACIETAVHSQCIGDR